MLSKNLSKKFLKINNTNFLKYKFFSTLSDSGSIKDYKTYKDHIITGYFNNGLARFVFSDISNIISNCRERFDLYEYNKLEYLNIAYNTTILMNSFLSGEERIKLTSQFSEEIYGENKVKVTSIYSESICTGEVRGFLEENILNQDEFEGEIDQFLKIAKILYNHKSEVSGMIRLNSNKLTENDIFRYFEESEQIRTYVKFSAYYKEKIDKMISQGFILQKMPDCNLDILDGNYRKIIESSNFDEILENGLSISRVEKLFQDLKLDVKITTRTPIDFFCRCSIETFKTALKTFSAKEIKEMREINHNKLKCKACNTNYSLSDKDFDDILKDIKI